MNSNERLKKMHDDVADMPVMPPELYETLPRNDYYGLEQLLGDKQNILKAHLR